MVIQDYKLNEQKETKKSPKKSQVKNLSWSGVPYIEPPKKKRNLKWLLYLWLVVGVLAVLSYGLKLATEWYEVNTFVFKPLVEIKFNKPISTEQRKPIEVVSPIVKMAEEPADFKDLDEVEKTILEVFGIADFKIARAIAIHENNYIGRGNKWDAEAIGINSKSIDVGIYQINSVHFKREGCSLKELLDVRKNIECAKSIYDEQGWNPWVVYQTGSFKRSL